MAPKRCAVEASASSEATGGGGGSEGGRGPIVVQQNPLWRGRISDPQDSNLVETHLTSRIPEGQAAGIKWSEPAKRGFFCSVVEEAERH